MTSIAGVDIGPNHPCRVVAEVSNAHNGSLERALRIIEAVVEAGADFVKFQCYTPDELVLLRGDGPAPDPWGTEGWSMRDLYEKAQTPHGWFPKLVEKCEEVGLPWFSSVFGSGSLELLESLACPAYKIAALDADSVIADYFEDGRHHADWDSYVPVIASSRGDRVPWADLTLYCPPGYPQEWGPLPPPGIYDGVSYHGTNTAFISALAPHALMVECHVQLDDEPSELEANVSLNVSDLAKLCEAVKAVPHA